MDYKGGYLLSTLLRNFINRRMSEKLGSGVLSPSNATFLNMIADDGGISSNALADRLFSDKALASRSVRRMIGMGYVENRGKGRAYSLYITDSGRKVLDRFNAANEEVYAEIFSFMTEEEFSVMKGMFSKIYDRLMEMSENDS